MNWQYYYKAHNVDVVDGDTYDLMLDLGLDIYHKQRIRLYGVNTPETYGVSKDSEEYRRGKKAAGFAKRMLRKVLREEGYLVVQTFKDHKGKYGRYLADILVPVYSVYAMDYERACNTYFEAVRASDKGNEVTLDTLGLEIQISGIPITVLLMARGLAERYGSGINIQRWECRYES